MGNVNSPEPKYPEMRESKRAYSEPDMAASMRGFSESALSSGGHSHSLYATDPIMTRFGESPRASGGMDGATPIGDFVIGARTIGSYGDA